MTPGASAGKHPLSWIKITITVLLILITLLILFAVNLQWFPSSGFTSVSHTTGSPPA